MEVAWPTSMGAWCMVTPLIMCVLTLRPIPTAFEILIMCLLLPWQGRGACRFWHSHAIQHERARKREQICALGL